MAFWSRKTIEMCTDEAYGEGGPRLRRSLGVVGFIANVTYGPPLL